MQSKSKFISFTKSPFLAWAMALIGGIHIQVLRLSSIMQADLVAAAILYGACVLFFLPRKTFFSLFTAAAIGSAGFGLYWKQLLDYQSFTILTKGKSLDAIATVRDIRPLKHRYLKQRIALFVHDVKESSVQDNNEWTPANATIIANLNKPFDGIIGDVIVCKRLLFPQKGNKRYSAIRNRQYATLFPKKLDCYLLERPHFSIDRWLHNTRASLFGRLKKRLNPQTFSLFSTIFLGNKTEKNYSMPTIRASFKQWGIMHYLARSGLHLMIIIMLWHYLFSFFALSTLAQTLCMLLLVLFYSLLSWQSVSFLRALLMFFGYKLLTLTRIKIAPHDLVALVCIIILITNPHQLLCLDFQLSFSLTFALTWLRYVHLQLRKKKD